MATTDQPALGLQHPLHLPVVDAVPASAAGKNQPVAPRSPNARESHLRFEALSEARTWKLHRTRSRVLKENWKMAAKSIEKTIDSLRGLAETESQSAGATDWLLDNTRLLRTALRETRDSLKPARELPHIERGSLHPVPRPYAAALSYLRAVQHAFDEGTFVVYLHAAQSESSFQMGEVWALRPMMQIALLERIARIAETLVRDPQIETANGNPDEISLGTLITSLRRISEADWKELFEQLSETERILGNDPLGAYARMDFESRELYRKALAEFATYSHRREEDIARQAVAFARTAQRAPGANQRAKERRSHVGYYLIDKGKELLKETIGFRPPLARRVQEAILRWPGLFYLIGIGFSTVAILALLLKSPGLPAPSIVALVLLLLPAAEAAVGLMNHLTALLLPPRRLPKLDFSKGVPADSTAVVAVPTLLISEEQVKREVRDLEIRYLANRDPNLHFALLTDLPDSTRPSGDKDALVGLCSTLVQNLNRKYGKQRKGTFFLFHRHRSYNPSEGIWMGWERKRGKLLDFNNLLLNNDDGFPVKIGDTSLLSHVKYVLALDSDTQLPKDSAYRLIGTLAHPLHRAVIDPRTNTVIEGYTILQPRVGASIRSASRSRLAALFSGDTGFDIYTRAVSDVYQDLFAEGSFTGKGIYEVDTFQQVLNHRFPSNALLSHDLIEGAHARAGLVSDIEVIDDYPSHFSAYSRRKHRWVRGDWQIILWLFPRVPNYFGKKMRNPLSAISRWKILDNLRRSLTEIAMFLLLLASWLFLPGSAVYWTLAALSILSGPTYLQLILSVVRAGRARYSAGFWRQAVSEFGVSQLNVFLKVALLCHQSLVTLDAIVRTLVRMTLTRKKLLEWETAAEAELAANQKKRGPVEIHLDWTALLSLAIAVVLAVYRRDALLVAWPFLLAWCFTKLLGEWLSRPRTSKKNEIAIGNETFLRTAGLRTWRFFRRFSSPETNWLIPDNVQESPPTLAHRMSPTNLGLLLNSRLAAYDLGYLTAPEFVTETERTFGTMERLPQFNGHFLNWYDTQTLRPLEPRFISTVDSGNLVCCLWTLKNGCVELIREPLFRSTVWQGIRDHLNAIDELLGEDAANREALAEVQHLRLRIQSLGDDSLAWLRTLPSLEDWARRLERAVSKESSETRWWVGELAARLSSVGRLVLDFAPWLSSQFAQFVDDKLLPNISISDLNLQSARLILADLYRRLRHRTENETADREPRPAFDSLRELLLRSIRNSVALAERLGALAAKAEALVENMDFRFLYNPRRKLLSIGYDLAAQRLDPSHYSLLASEARSAVFAAIAKGDIPQESWFHLGRAHTLYKGERVLLSWTGTMFEYLLPSLWMRGFPNAILEESTRTAVRCQQRVARSKNVPWGISEAACCERNLEGDYRYHAFGVPGLALNPRPSSDIVASPYATFLSLQVDASGSIENLRVMKELNWLGAYGFYEAADFTPSRVRQNAKYELVRCWMAHHQGMSLVALANLLAGSPMHRRFHAQPMVAATERLLHEKLPRTVPIEHCDDQERKRSSLPNREQQAMSRSCYWPDQPTANVAT